MKTITLTKINNKEGFKFPISLNDGNDFLFFSKWTNLNQKDSLDNTFLMNFGNITENKEENLLLQFSLEVGPIILPYNKETNSIEFLDEDYDLFIEETINLIDTWYNCPVGEWNNDSCQEFFAKNKLE